MTPNRLHWLDPWLGRDVFPDWLIRVGIRRLLRQRLREERRGGVEAQQERLSRLVAELRRSPIAIHVEAANAQHYEVPAAFYQRVLGQRLKYSSGYWPEGVVTLDHAEEAMLALTCERAGVENGQRILELGCGWGSLSLWLAERYPQSRITAITNSRSQGAYIDSERRRLGLDRLAVVVTDMNVFETKERFDRVLSVEMFEHMRNYAELLSRIARWLEPEGRLFVHMFANVHSAYAFEDHGNGDWMARHFFTGGIMPSEDLLHGFEKELVINRQWRLNGIHYARTCEAWLANMDRHKSEILSLFGGTYGAKEARRRWVYWRVFFRSCAELFAYARGEEWVVAHYVLEKS